MNFRQLISLFYFLRLQMLLYLSDKGKYLLSRLKLLRAGFLLLLISYSFLPILLFSVFTTSCRYIYLQGTRVLNFSWPRFGLVGRPTGQVSLSQKVVPFIISECNFIMGNSSSGQGDWVLLEDKGPYQVRRSKGGLEIEEYSTLLSSRKQLSDMMQRVSARKSRFANCRNVVQVFDCRSEEVAGPCSSNHRLFTITERIPRRIPQVARLQQQQFLFLLHQTLCGYRELANHFGCCFQINAQMVGLNRNGDVRVWHNSDFGAGQPQVQLVGPKHAKLNHQHQLVEKVIKVVLSAATQEVADRFEAQKRRLKAPYSLNKSIQFVLDYAEREIPTILQKQQHIAQQIAYPKKESKAVQVAAQLPEGKLKITQQQRSPFQNILVSSSKLAEEEQLQNQQRLEQMLPQQQAPNEDIPERPFQIQKLVRLHQVFSDSKSAGNQINDRSACFPSQTALNDTSANITPVNGVQPNIPRPGHSLYIPNVIRVISSSTQGLDSTPLKRRVTFK